MEKIRDIYDLRAAYKEKHPSGHYFDQATLKWMGERLSEMRVLKKKVVVKDSLGEEHTCYCVSAISRTFPGGPRRTYNYFDVGTLDVV